MKNYKLLLLLMTSSLFSLNAFAAHHEESPTVVIGDIEMAEVTHSEGFNEMKKMLGKW